VDEVTGLLGDLVRIPSVNPMGRPDATRDGGYFETALTNYIEDYFHRHNISCYRQAVAPGRDNLIARVEAPGARRTLLFDAHQDTVSADGMTVAPFGAHVEGGRLHGRGACDIKGGLAAMLLAVARLARERPRGAASVVLACTVDEEYTHTGSSALAADPPAPSIDLAVVAEPTRFDIITSHKGAVRWAITARGRACHSSTPELGDNAIYRMARVLGALEDQARELGRSAADPVLGAPSLSVGVIAGGAGVNIVPDACVIQVDRRVIPGEDPDGAVRGVVDHLRAQLDPADFGHLEFGAPWVRMPALRPCVASETLTAIGDVVAQVTGRRPAVGGVPYGTDAGPLGRAGLRCVVLGPGDIAQAHTEDEWIELDAVRAAGEVYYGLAVALGG
jgi:acetylornithine deacetylase/succinyl-diaminopimelate desuccinylase-like protein